MIKTTKNIYRETRNVSAYGDGVWIFGDTLKFVDQSMVTDMVVKDCVIP